MASSERPRFEMADIVRSFGESYQARRNLPVEHLRVMQNIEDCRTAVLGGHMEECDTCSHQRPVYNSCRDRHCPKCQTLTKEKWLEARKADLLPVNYFHQVFTIPHELNWLTLLNKVVMLNILFKAVSETLTDFGRDPKQRLGGKVGFTLVLHTWNQKLLDHFHIHCVMPAGALGADESWIHGKYDNYLFPVKALSLAFRGKFIDLLCKAFEKDELVFVGSIAELAHPIRFEGLIDSLSSKPWNVYSKAPFGGPEKVLNYLGRYTHRVAISNHRIADVSDDKVSFKYRDRRDSNKEKVETISGSEFLRRFLLHTLPSGFVRIRHYGFLASRSKNAALTQCREALDSSPPTLNTESPETPEEHLLRLTGIDILACPCCSQGRMRKTRELPKLGAMPQRFKLSKYLDTS
ncbi:MAG: IS91 family transposase [Desulfobulbaceae bacterium]|nr:IS91 family transposase [Desulfobulbaceae bacterium]